MSQTKLEKLFYTIGLIDNVSGVPTNKILKNIDKMKSHAKNAFTGIAKGTAGLVGAGFGIKKLTDKAIDFNRALGEVDSLDVQSDAMKILARTALKQGPLYGQGAAEFIRASYDIQSAIAGLDGSELADFTKASSILAKATKSDAATITSFTGTMFGIFQNQAKEMGKSLWVEILAGQTATAVQMFKTTGSEMSAAFSGVGAAGTAHGINMAEQMAILGSLQATMKGAEAATKYKAFLGGVGKAQKALGLTFVDSQGKMLPMVDILNRIKGKFGEIDTVAESDLLQKAFGTKEAVSLIKQLMLNTDGLSDSIEKLNDVTGMGKALEMARKQTDVWMRLRGSLSSAAIMFGSVLLPVLEPVIQSLLSASVATMKWAEENPRLTRLIGMLTLGIFAGVAIISTFLIVSGLASFAMAGWSAAVVLFNGVLVAFNTVMAISRWLMLSFALASFLVGAPIWLIIAAVTALIAAVALLIKYWDTLKAKFLDSSAFKVMSSVVGSIAGFVGFDSAPDIKTGADSASQQATGNEASTAINNAIANNQKNINVEKIEMNGTDKTGFDIFDELAMAAG